MREGHKLTVVLSGRGCSCGWSSDPQQTWNEADHLAAEHIRETR